MKATGVVRRIDNLGRIVIPKEIRKNLRIQNGDNLEIFMDENENILLRKYSQINKLKDVSGAITDSVSSISNHTIFVTNNDEFIAGSGKLKKEYLNSKISNELLKILNNRKTIFNQKEKIKLTKDNVFEGSFVISPIIASGDAIGLVIMIDKEEISDNDAYIIKVISNFLAKHIEQ